jgi:DNA polymerase-4
MHVDVNSAFLSWSAVQRLKDGDKTDLRMIPSAVGGDEKQRKGIILAKSIPAKKMGVQTGEAIWQAKQKCPGLVVVPGDYDLYSHMSNLFMAVARDYSPVIQQYSIDECFIDYTGMEGVMGPCEQAADRLRQAIRDRLGFTVSVGVSSCKVLAKMAGELKKPDAVSTVYRYELADKLWPLPVRELFMVGPATERRLHSLGIFDIGGIARADPALLQRHMGKHGVLIWNYANGVDPDPVVPGDDVPMKSYSQSATLPRDMRGPEELLPVFARLCTALGYRMRDGGGCCRVVSIYFRDKVFRGWGRQKRLERATDITFELMRALTDLFWRTYDGSDIRAVGVAFSDIIPSECFSFSLFDGESIRRKSALDAACDRMRDRYGGRAVLTARELLSPEFAHLSRYAPGTEKPRIFCPY